MRCKLKTQLGLSVFLFMVVLCFSVYAADGILVFSDDFDDGFIDDSKWIVSVDGFTEADGVLRMFRDTADDEIHTIDSFSGYFEVELSIKLEQISWQDMFHGISLFDAAGNGISFGFCQYGKFYQAICESGSTAFYYGSPFQLNKWYQ